MTGLSLFSGIGGLDLAFEWAGGTVAAMCEIDPFCRKVLRKHWPDVPLFGDVKELKGTDVEVETVDVIYGGYPCQPFSVAGNRKGQDDDRYLWPEFSRLVGELGPRWVVAENVPGIMSLAADDVCQDLERLGYSVGIWNFEAAAVGAPHRRARVFFVAHSDRAGILRDGSVRGWTREAQQAVMGGAGSYIPHSTSCRWDVVSSAESGEHPERLEAGGFCGDLPYPDRQRCEEQRNGIPAGQELGSAERCGRGKPEPGLGRGFDGISPWMDRDWEKGLPRICRGIPDRVKRLKALGNAVVPQQVYPIFRAIVEVEHHGKGEKQ